MPAAWKNSAISRDSGAPPETAKRSRPPRRAWSLREDQLVGDAPLEAEPARHRLARLLVTLDAARPTATAQWKILRLTGGRPRALASTPA